MDKLNEREAQDLLYHGIEDRHYIVQDGIVIRQTAEGVSETEKNDLSMLLTFIPKDLTTPVETDELRKQITKVQAENEKSLHLTRQNHLPLKFTMKRGTSLIVLLTMQEFSL